MESEPMSTPREKSPLPEKNSPQRRIEPTNPQHCIKQDSKPNTLPTSYPPPPPPHPLLCLELFVNNHHLLLDYWTSILQTARLTHQSPGCRQCHHHQCCAAAVTGWGWTWAGGGGRGRVGGRQRGGVLTESAARWVRGWTDWRRRCHLPRSRPPSPTVCLSILWWTWEHSYRIQL